MLAVGPNAALSVTNPLLVFYTQASGTLVDPIALSFRILDTSNDAKKLTPVQAFPGSGFQAVNLTSDKLGAGRHAATWTVPSSLPFGLYTIEWQYQLPPQPDMNGQLVTQPALRVQQQFEVLAAAPTTPVWPYYCLVSDMRDEGVSPSVSSDAQVMLRIRRASKQIEDWTGRFFEPRYFEIQLNGNGSSVTLLEMPVIAVETLRFQTSPLFPSDLAVEADFYRVYNRHLRRMAQYDDRNNPKIELFSASEDLAGVRPFSFSRLIFPHGAHNVKVLGVWGYTDYDGSPYGFTPEGIRRATMLLVMRDLRKLADVDRREDSLRRSRIVSEGTRDQNYSLAASASLGLATNLTGDPEIDQLIVQYIRPPALGGA